MQVSYDLFPTLGVGASLGRLFTEEDDAYQAPRTVVLSHEYWQQRFGGESSAVGQTLQVNGRETEVLDYLVKGFTYAETASYLGITPHTVATHVRRIYRKLAVRSRAEAVYEAMQLGLVDER